MLNSNQLDHQLDMPDIAVQYRRPRTRSAPWSQYARHGRRNQRLILTPYAANAIRQYGLYYQLLQHRDRNKIVHFKIRFTFPDFHFCYQCRVSMSAFKPFLHQIATKMNTTVAYHVKLRRKQAYHDYISTHYQIKALTKQILPLYVVHNAIVDYPSYLNSLFQL